MKNGDALKSLPDKKNYNHVKLLQGSLGMPCEEEVSGLLHLKE